MDWVATCCGERYLILQTATNSHLPFTLHFSLLKLLAWISHWYLNMLPQRRPYKSRGGETTKTPNSLQEKKLLWCSWRPFSGFIHGSTPVGGSEKSLCACTLRKRSFPSLPLFSCLVPIYVCWYLFVHFIQSSRVNSHTFKLQKKCKIKYCSVLSTISEGFVFFFPRVKKTAKSDTWLLLLFPLPWHSNVNKSQIFPKELLIYVNVCQGGLTIILKYMSSVFNENWKHARF